VWEDIAKQLNSRRTAAQCLMRYQQNFNPHMRHSKWTPEEDEHLRHLVSIYGITHGFDSLSAQLTHLQGYRWVHIAAELPGRTTDQVAARWKKSLDPRLRKGHWTEEEDQQLSRL
jgi:myb proto-oncogene protein